MVGAALVVTTAEHDIHRGFDSAVPFVVEQHCEQLLVQVVDQVVVLFDLYGETDAPAGDRAAGLGQDSLRQLAHLDDDSAQLGRDGAGRITPPGDGGDVPRIVAGALQVAHDSQTRDDGPQITGDRLLGHQQLERPGLDIGREGVDDRIVGDDLLGQREIRIEKGLSGSPQRASYPATEGHQ